MLIRAPRQFDISAEKGFTSVRLPFKWERLQPKLKGGLDPAELKRLDDTVARLKAARLWVVLDPHNFAVYNQKQINGPDVPTEPLRISGCGLPPIMSMIPASSSA